MRRVPVSSHSSVPELASSNPRSSFMSTTTLSEATHRFYFLLFTPAVQRSMCAISVIWIVWSFLQPKIVSTLFYLIVEVFLASFFIAEVAVRYSVQRTEWHESPVHIVGDFVTAAFCLVVLTLLLVAHHTTRAEHNMLILLRFVSQGLRLRLWWTADDDNVPVCLRWLLGKSNTANSSTDIEVFAPGQGTGHHAGHCEV